MLARAKLSNCPMSARKMRLVADIIRGKDADAALDILKFTRKEAAEWLEKLLLSAVNNWEQKTAGEDPDEYELYIIEILVNQGPQLKRIRPVPFGRAHRIRKHTCHVKIVMDNRVYLPGEEEEEVDVDEEIVQTEG